MYIMHIILNKIALCKPTYHNRYHYFKCKLRLERTEFSFYYTRTYSNLCSSSDCDFRKN